MSQLPSCTRVHSPIIAAWFWESGELWRPENLVALPLLLFAWWVMRRRTTTREVATTFIWRRLPQTTARQKTSWWLFAFVLTCGLALTTPMAWRPPPVAGDSHAARGTAVTGVESAELRASRRPLPREPIYVRDLTASPAIATALAALSVAATEGPGLAQVVSADGATETVDVELSADVPATGDAQRRILFLGSGQGLLPMPQPVVGHPLLAGLNPERWSVVRCRTTKPTSWPVDEIVIDSDLGPLLYRSGDSFVFLFTPADSDLPQHGIWPVLLGRILEDLAGPRGSAPPQDSPSPWPTWLLLACATLLALRLGLTRARTYCVAALLVGAALCAPGTRTLNTIGIGTPGHPRVSELSDGSGSWLTEARSLGAGGTLRWTTPPPPPVDPQVAIESLRSRGVSIEVTALRPPLTADRQRCDLGTPVTLRAVGAHDRLAPVLQAIAPDGARTALPAAAAAGSPPSANETAGNETGASEIRWEHTPGSAGVWQYHLERQGRRVGTAVVVVQPPLEVLVLAGDPRAGLATIGASSGFEQRNNSALQGALRLPGGGAHESGIVVLDGYDPSTLPLEEVARLRQWILDGGTLIASAGPPYFTPSDDADGALERFNDLLPAPLPAPPQRLEHSYGIILLDLSGSLRGESIASLGTGVSTLLAGTPEGGRWGVAYFRDEAGWLAPPGTAVDAAMIERVSALSASGGTRLDRALPFVLAELQKVGTGRALILLTDGQVTLPSPAQAGAQIRAADIDLRIIALGDNPNEALLRTLSSNASGSYEWARSAPDAAAALANAFRKAPERERATAGSLRHASASPVLTGVAATTPAPIHYTPASPWQGATAPLWVDDVGAPVLLHRTLGSGHALLLCASLAQSNTTSVQSTERLLRDLTAIATNCARGRPKATRRAGIARDVTGTDWLTFPVPGAAPGAPIEVTLLEPAEAGEAPRQRPAAAVALSGDRAGVRGVGPEALAVQHGEEWLPVHIDRAAWRDIVVATAGAASAPRWPIDILATIGAVLLALAGLRRRNLGS